MGFYRAYKTEQEAKEVAKELRTPKGSTKHKYGYPASVTVKRIKVFGYDRKPVWAVYIYKRR